jgi:hypothetical protein
MTAAPRLRYTDERAIHTQGSEAAEEFGAERDHGADTAAHTQLATCGAL